MSNTDKQTFEVNAKVTFQIPSVPNFLIISGNGIGENHSIPVSEMTTEALIEVSEAWTRELLKKSKYYKG